MPDPYTPQRAFPSPTDSWWGATKQAIQKGQQARDANTFQGISSIAPPFDTYVSRGGPMKPAMGPPTSTWDGEGNIHYTQHPVTGSGYMHRNPGVDSGNAVSSALHDTFTMGIPAPTSYYVGVGRMHERGQFSPEYYDQYQEARSPYVMGGAVGPTNRLMEQFLQQADAQERRKRMAGGILEYLIGGQ